VYQRDAYRIVRSLLVGGKGVPETVSQHPAVFSTLTAPSFGEVHTRSRNGTPAPIGGPTGVSFGAAAASNLAVVSDTALTVTSPRAAASGPVDVTVTTPAGTSAPPADQFTYT
jgi:hypothetical protein